MADDQKNRRVTDEEVTALAKVIARHCPLLDQCDGDWTDADEAESIAAEFSPSMRRFKSWSKTSEARHLEAWAGASRKLRDEFFALDEALRIYATIAANPLLKQAGLRSRPHLINLHHIIEELPKIVEQSVTAAKKRLNDGFHTGKTNWLEVNIADQCCDVWFRRTGNEAPRSISNTGPFPDFLYDVFDILKPKGKPIPAMAARCRILWPTSPEYSSKKC